MAVFVFRKILLQVTLLVRHLHSAQAQGQGCHTSVIGAGPGGIYFAWRLADANPSRAKGICIFERSERFGGRIFSLRGLGPERDLTAEVGAYRFNDAPMVESWGSGFTEYVFTPLMAAIIKNALKIPCAKYEPGNPNSTMLKIVDAEGNNAGLHTFVERMLQLATLHGVRMFNKTSLQSVVPLPSGGLQLHFDTGLQVNTSSVLLNLPQLPLLKVMQQSGRLLEHQSYPSVWQSTRPVEAAKLYVYYEDAWWRNYLDLRSGEFNIGSSGKQEPPLSGRYHDGDVRCNGKTCRGFIEASYVYAESANFFVTHQLNADPPVTLINMSRPEGSYLLRQVHDALYTYHEAMLQAAGMAEKVRTMFPLFAILSHWDTQSIGFGGGVHGYRQGPIPLQKVPVLGLAPLKGVRLFVANEAFGSIRAQNGTLGGIGSWAECSLVMTENVLSAEFGLPLPAWIDPQLYATHVKYPDTSQAILLHG